MHCRHPNRCDGGIVISKERREPVETDLCAFSTKRRNMPRHMDMRLAQTQEKGPSLTMKTYVASGIKDVPGLDMP